MNKQFSQDALEIDYYTRHDRKVLGSGRPLRVRSILTFHHEWMVQPGCFRHGRKLFLEPLDKPLDYGPFRLTMMSEEFSQDAFRRSNNYTRHGRKRFEHGGYILDAVLAGVSAPRLINKGLHIGWYMDLWDDLYCETREYWLSMWMMHIGKDCTHTITTLCLHISWTLPQHKIAWLTVLANHQLSFDHFHPDPSI